MGGAPRWWQLNAREHYYSFFFHLRYSLYVLQPDIELANMRNPTKTNPLTADTHTMLHTHRPGNLFCHPRVPGTDLRTLTPYVSMGLICSGTHNERKHAMHVPVRLS